MGKAFKLASGAQSSSALPDRLDALQNDPDSVRKSLFVISCSACKSRVHIGSGKWFDMIDDPVSSAFQEFAPLRRELANYYSNIDSEEGARRIYRGFINQNPSRWENAWKTNLELPSSGTNLAIQRYTGHLYKQLDCTVIQALADRIISNVMIISALHGPTLPSDMIPYYDLTMQDEWKDGNKLGDKWPRWVRDSSGQQIREFLARFNTIYVMAGEDYRGTAKSLAKITEDAIEYIEVPSSRSQPSISWGRQLNTYLLALLRSMRQSAQGTT